MVSQQSQASAETEQLLTPTPSLTSAHQTSSRLSGEHEPPSPLAQENEHNPTDAIIDSTKAPQAVLSETVEKKNGVVLQHRKRDVFPQVLLDIFMAILPCLFIVLGIVAACLNGQYPSSYGQKVEQAARLGPTIFPIAFAAIVARFYRHLARWQAEKGQYLGVSCRSVGFRHHSILSLTSSGSRATHAKSELRWIT